MNDGQGGYPPPPPPPPPPPGGPGYQPPGFGTPGYQPPPYGAPHPPPPPPGYGPPGWQPAHQPPPGYPPAPLPPLEYHQVYLSRSGWGWRIPVGILSLGVALILVVPLLLQIPFFIYYAATDQDVVDSLEKLLDLDNPTPLGLAYLNLALASAIPVTWLLIRTLQGLKPRWLASVRPRLRWRFLFVCFGLAAVALVATVMVSAVLPAQDTGTELNGQLNDFTRTTRDFLLVVLFLTPLQAAGEEYAFRGYLTQGFGALMAGVARRSSASARTVDWLSRGAAVVIPAVLFALAHGIGQSAPIFFDRFAFGVVAGILVIVTGGLEAGIAMHVLNNWLAFSVALAYGDMGSSLSPTGGSWWSIPVTLTQSLVYLALAWWLSRAMGLATRTDPAVLEASRRRV
jgi:membrane protease YdiL (CAAX protease family)